MDIREFNSVRYVAVPPGEGIIKLSFDGGATFMTYAPFSREDYDAHMANYPRKQGYWIRDGYEFYAERLS